MLEIHSKISAEADTQPDDSVALSYDLRQKSRIRVTLASGDEAAIFMPRGTILRGGDRIMASDGRVIQVFAADQDVMKVTALSERDLTRACYHLGNRHVPLEIGNGYLKLETDKVLKEMLLGLGGVSVRQMASSFEPEAGAYGGGHHHHDDESDNSLSPYHA